MGRWSLQLSGSRIRRRGDLRRFIRRGSGTLIWGILIGIPIGAATLAVVLCWPTLREIYIFMRFGG